MNILDRKFGNATVIVLVTTLLLTIGVFATACSDDLNSRDSKKAQIVFVDVSQDDWFHRYVTLGLRFGIIKGVSDNGSLRFEPNRSVTRAEFITMLGRLHEYGNETIGTPDEGAFYERYLDWAVQMGIIHGNEYGDLMPKAFVTREQMAVIVVRYINVFQLWRYVRYEGITTTGTFHDYNEMSFWASGAIESLRTNLLAFGSHENYFRPRDETTRAETLAILATIALRLY